MFFILFFSILLGIWMMDNKLDNLNLLEIESRKLITGELVEFECVVEELNFKDGKTNLVVSLLNSSYKGKVRIQIESKVGDIVEKDIVIINSIFEVPENYDDFNYSEYLARQEIFLVGKSDGVVLKTNGSGIINSIARLRSTIIRNVRKYFGEPEASLLLGLTIGYRADFDESFNDSLQKTGTTHIIAVSGYNVSLIMVIVMGFLSNLDKRFSYLIGFIFLFIFCVITNFNIPVLRSAFMFVIILLVKEFGRDCSCVLSLFLSSLILFIINPFILWNLSFQLSFFSTLGLIVGGLFDIDNESFLTDLFKDTILSTFWAFIFTFPVIVYTFGQFTILTFLSNLLVLPFINMSTIMGLVFILIVFINDLISKTMLFFIWPVLHLVYKIIDWVSMIPFGIISFHIDSKGVFLYYLILILLISIFYFLKNDRGTLDENKK